MALPKIKEVRAMTDEQIADQVLAVKKELFELRLQQAIGKLEQTHLFKHKRHRLAQLLTVEKERQLQPQEEQA